MTSRDSVSFQSNSPDKEGIESNEIIRTQRTSTEASKEITECNNPEDILAAIADSDCRAILAESGDKPVSVSNIVNRYDMSTATAYRKVNTLVNAGLLHERIQIHPYGRNECEYSLRISSIHVTLTESGIPEATVSLASKSDDQPGDRAFTDGAAAQKKDSSSVSGFESVLIDITGAERRPGE